MFLRSERVFSVSVDRDDSSRAWHLELEVCVVWHLVELCKRGTSEPLDFLVYPSRYGSDEQFYHKRPREEKKPERKRKSEGMPIQERLSRIVDHGLDVPPSMPMLF